MRFSSFRVLSTYYYFGGEKKKREVSFDTWIIFENYCLLKLNYLAGR